MKDIEDIAEEKYPSTIYSAGGIPFDDTICEIKRAAFISGSQYGKEWVSVEERLPKGITRVLCLCQSGHIEVGYYDCEWQSDNTFKTFKDRGYVVSHWMLLPEPPKL